jgi:hypothetical protein
MSTSGLGRGIELLTFSGQRAQKTVTDARR